MPTHLARVRPSQDDWFRFKPEIRRLYLVGKITLQQLRLALESRGLVVTSVCTQPSIYCRVVVSLTDTAASQERPDRLETEAMGISEELE